MSYLFRAYFLAKKNNKQLLKNLQKNRFILLLDKQYNHV
jgi:hypothetical protein